MRTSNANYDTYNAALQKTPVFTVTFGSYTTGYATGDFADIGSDPGGIAFKTHIKSMRISQVGAIPFLSDVRSSEVEVEIADMAPEFTAFLQVNPIFEKSMTVKMGFAEIDHADFVSVLPNSGLTVKSLKLSADGLTWHILARDVFYGRQELLFRADSNFFIGLSAPWRDAELTADITTASTSLTLDSDEVDIFPDPTTVPGSGRLVAALLIDNEVIEYTTINYTTGSLGGLVRGAGGSIAAAHSAGTRARPLIGYYCDPLRILLHFLTGADGTNGPYDLGVIACGPNLEYKTGLAIPYTFINIENIERIGWKMFHLHEYNSVAYFYWGENINNAFNYLAEKFLQPHGLYWKIGFSDAPQAGSGNTAAGKIDIGMADFVDWVENFSSAFTLDDNNGEIESLSRYDLLDEEMVNALEFNYDHDHGKDQYRLASNLALADGQTLYGVRNALVVKHPGYAPGADTDQLTTILSYRFMQYMDMPALLKFRAFFSTSLIEPGDKFLCSLSSLPDISGGVRGWSAKKGMITGQQIVYRKDDENSGDCYIEYEARTWDAVQYVFDADSGLYTITKIAEGDINDKTLSVNTNETATTQTQDAYYSNAGNIVADRWIFFIRITPTGSGSGSRYLKLKISALDGTPAIINSETKDYIRFDTADTTPIIVELDLVSLNSAGDTINRAKVDWISTTAAGAEIPTVEFIGLWFVKTKQRFG